MPSSHEVIPMVRPVTEAIGYEAAVKELETISRNNWRIGEIADRVQPKYGEGTLQQLAEESGIDYSVLQECRRVYRAWPENTIRMGNLSWSIHTIFASQLDRFDLIKQRKWTAKEAREEVRRRNHPEEPESDDKESVPPPSPPPPPLKPFNARAYTGDFDRMVSIVSGIRENYGTIEKMIESAIDTDSTELDRRQCLGAIIDASDALAEAANEARAILYPEGVVNADQ